MAAINASAGLDIKAPDGDEILKLKPGSLLASDTPKSSAINNLIRICSARLALHMQQGGLRHQGRSWCTSFDMSCLRTQLEVSVSTAPEAQALRQEVAS